MHRDVRFAYNTAYAREVKRQVIAGYGGKCRCCGEATFEFLTLEHVGGGGGRKRRTTEKGMMAWRLALREGFPPRYEVLCMNCNLAVGMYGRCPHQGLR